MKNSENKTNYVRKCVDKYNRKAVIQYTLKGEFYAEWETVGEIFRVKGFDKSAILRCCKGKQKKSYHYIWKFKEDVIKQTTIMEETNHGSNIETLSEVILKAKATTEEID